MRKKDLVLPKNSQPSNFTLSLPTDNSPNCKTISFPKVDTFEEEVDLFVEYYNNNFKNGEGFFFDFSRTPEHKEPILNGLIEKYGWILERPYFIRKGKRIEDLEDFEDFEDLDD